MAGISVVRFGVIVLVMMVMAAEATPPGIANHPSRATCKIKKYKHCYNLEHVCPKFCPDSCSVECASCKPICGPPSEEEPGNGPPSEEEPGEKDNEKPKDNKPTTPPSEEEPGEKHNEKPKDNKPTTPPSEEEPEEKPKPPSKENPNNPSPQPSTPHTPPSQPTTPSQPTPSTPPSQPSPPYTPPSQPSPSTPPSQPTPPTPSQSPSPPYIPPSHPSPPYIPPSEPTRSTPTPSSQPPPASSSAPKRAKCEDPKYTHCYNQEHVCPKSCPGECEVNCHSCKPICKCDKPGSVCQDPRFIGGDGLTFYFHGKKDQDFCLLSDPNLHINAHFIGRRNPTMSRDFTWVQSIGLLFHTHKISISALNTSTWLPSHDRLALSFDGHPVLLPHLRGATWHSPTSPCVTFTRLSDTNSVALEVLNKFRISATVTPITEEESRVHGYGVTREDCFAHLDLGFKFYALSDEVSGVLGQTYANKYVSRVKAEAVMPVMGGYREFVTSSLFATDCAVAQFGGNSINNEGSDEEYPSMISCESGLGGRGIVCKK